MLIWYKTELYYYDVRTPESKDLIYTERHF